MCRETRSAFLRGVSPTLDGIVDQVLRLAKDRSVSRCQYLSPIPLRCLTLPLFLSTSQGGIFPSRYAAARGKRETWGIGG